MYFAYYKKIYLSLDCMKKNKKLNECYRNHGFENKSEGEEPSPHKLWERKV